MPTLVPTFLRSRNKCNATNAIGTKLVYEFTITCLLLGSGFVIGGTAASISSARQTKSCQSVDQHGKSVPGQCTQFVLCPRLLEFAKRPGKTIDDFRLLKTLTCGFNKDEPWQVCCPEKDIYRPPLPEEDSVKLALEFPDEESTYNALPKGSEKQGSPDVSFAVGKERYGLIPRLEDCGEPSIDLAVSTRIIGGSKAERGQFPYMALLYRLDTVTDEEEYYCSGTIINQFYILTAAHCILTNHDSSHKLAYVQVGVTDVTERCYKNNQTECSSERRYEVKDTVIHPKYIYGSRDRSHDIALIRTAKPMDFDDKYIRPVCLPLSRTYGFAEASMVGRSDDERNGKSHIVGHGIVAGWGRESNNGTQSATMLKHAILPILTKSECQSLYSSQVRISEKQVCAGGEVGRDTCVGDSGGPLLIPFEPEADNEWEQRFRGKMFQTGIISFGPALCGRSGKPSVYTKILPYVEWLLDSMYL